MAPASVSIRVGAVFGVVRVSCLADGEGIFRVVYTKVVAGVHMAVVNTTDDS